MVEAKPALFGPDRQLAQCLVHRRPVAERLEAHRTLLVDRLAECFGGAVADIRHEVGVHARQWIALPELSGPGEPVTTVLELEQASGQACFGQNRHAVERDTRRLGQLLDLEPHRATSESLQEAAIPEQLRGVEEQRGEGELLRPLHGLEQACATSFVGLGHGRRSWSACPDPASQLLFRAYPPW